MRAWSNEQSTGKSGHERAQGNAKHLHLFLDRGEDWGEESRLALRHLSFALRHSAARRLGFPVVTPRAFLGTLRASA